MRRKLSYWVLALLAPLGFVSCSQEEVAPPMEEIRLNITAGGVQTRVNTLGTGDVWENGDELYFCRVSKESQWAKYSLTATVSDEVTTWSPSSKLYWDGKGEHRLIVSHPCNLELGWDEFVIPDNQNTLENLKKADRMNAMWKGTPTTEPINLTLKHRLSMVTVTYTLASEFESTVEITPEVYSKTLYISFDVNTLERKEVAWEEGDDIWVKAYKHEEVDTDGKVVAKKFTAIVSPDAYAAGNEFIRITIGDQVLTAKMQKNITFEEGNHYTFDLKIGKDVSL